MILTSDLGVVRKDCRQHTALDVIGSQMGRARAEATILVQRKAAAAIQDSELVHVDVHASLVPARQLRPGAQANDRDSHKMNDNAASWQARRAGATPPGSEIAGSRLTGSIAR